MPMTTPIAPQSHGKAIGNGSSQLGGNNLAVKSFMQWYDGPDGEPGHFYGNLYLLGTYFDSTGKRIRYQIQNVGLVSPVFSPPIAATKMCDAASLEFTFGGVQARVHWFWIVPVGAPPTVSWEIHANNDGRLLASGKTELAGQIVVTVPVSADAVS